VINGFPVECIRNVQRSANRIVYVMFTGVERRVILSSAGPAAVLFDHIRIESNPRIQVLLPVMEFI